jgi:hypothetical protein
MRGKRVMAGNAGNVQDGIFLAHDGLGIRLAAAFTPLGVSAWLGHPRVYVYSTIQPASYIGDNFPRPTGYAKYASLNQYVGSCG